MQALNEFRELRETLRSQPEGDGGLETCAALTTALDGAIASLAERVSDEPAAVIALGGYGRGEQCLWSDVDVMLLHTGADTARLAKAVLYPLWDANLKVGHSVRTVRECATAARDRFETLTTLLSARLVAGDPRLMADLESTMARLLSGRPLAPKLAAMERKRRRAHPYPVMTADVKAGRGALRTFQGVWWERRRASLLGHNEVPATDDEREAHAALLAVRNALHAATGRAIDVYEFDLREPVARWLGSDVLTVSRRLCAALRTGDRLAERHWPDLLVDTGPLAGGRLSSAVRRRFATAEGDGEEGPLLVAARAVRRPGAMILDVATREAFSTDITGTLGDADRSAFIEIISSGERGRVAFGWLEDAGWLGRWFPEWKAVTALPELAPFHEHPVDAHLWRTVDEMRALVTRPAQFAADIIAELGSTEELLLAAFLHDIGKGTGRDHSSAGAEAAASFLRRARFGPAIQADVVAAIRNHLLLGRTATRSDTADPAVIDEVADAVGGLRSLQILYLLTIADARATGRTMWSEWKATLLRELYIRVAGRFGVPGADSPTVDAGEVARLSGGRHPERTVAEHLAAMPADYAAATPEADVVWHLDAVSSLSGPVGVSVDPSGNRVLVTGGDRRGFLLAVCSAFAASGIAVLDARLSTRGDGTVIDVFEVRDDRSGDLVAADRLARFEETLAAVIVGDRDVRRTVEERAAAYPAPASVDVVVRAGPPDSHRHTVLEVRAPDRIGLLVAIAEALYSEGLDVYLAKVDTRAGEAVDTFHVRRLGVPIRTEPELAALTRRIEDRLRG
jgi:[protein-PII] uridylyltransferase